MIDGAIPGAWKGEGSAGAGAGTSGTAARTSEANWSNGFDMVAFVGVYESQYCFCRETVVSKQKITVSTRKRISLCLSR